ncbi:multimerin-2 [Brachyhypopomus gauderio]|uniref:multimerin-2 n=1 Tax=Brachyhypopomus gauderio TaxID=698409 RepID=UPI0040436DC6
MVLTLVLSVQPLLVVLLLNVVPSHGELRARDPGVGEGRQGTFGPAHWPTTHGSPFGAPQPPAGTSARLLQPWRGSSQPATRAGNWCAFVHRRVLTVAVLCGTDDHPPKSATPCPGRDPERQMTRGAPSSRPAYRQTKRILTALHWKCCSGYGGSDCQETVNHREGESHASEEDTGEANMEASGVEDRGVRTEDALLQGTAWEDSPGQVSPHGPALAVPALFAGVGAGGAMRPPLPFMDSTSVLAVHQGFAAMMTRLQPVLAAFNRSLGRLSTDVEAISMDLQKLRQNQEIETSHSGQVHRGTIEEKLADSFEQIRQIQAQLNTQEKQIEQTAQSQHALLQQNLTNLKEEIDHHINQSHEDIQGSLQSLTASVEQIRLGQERLEGLRQGERPLSVPPTGGQSELVSSAWDAISSLDKKVLNNTMQLSALSENSRHIASTTQNLERGLQNLSQILERVSWDSELRFAEAGLEVEAARVAAMSSINEVGANLSAQANQLRELELYVDSFYENLQSNGPSQAEETCRCKELRDSVVRLEQEVANVTDLARENRYTLEDAEAKKGQDYWNVELEDLHQGLLSVKESLAFEQVKSRTLGEGVSQLKASLLVNQQEILEFKESVVAKSAEIRHLSKSFSSLLKDAIRHSDVLEVLLGHEVMEFLSWPANQQHELSVPALLQRMQLLQERVESQESRLNPLRNEEKGHMTTDAPGAFSEHGLTSEQGRASTDQQDSSASASAREGDGDASASDIWNLGQKMEELSHRLSQLEEQRCNCTGPPSGTTVELQREVTSLQQALGDHLRMFQNLFTYKEEPSRTPRSLNVDQLWAMINGKDGKRKVKRQASGRLCRGRRGTATTGPACSSVAFIAGLDDGRMKRDRLLFEKVMLNHGHAYRPSSGAFHAPQAGVYLFLVNLDCETGPCLAHLMRDSVPVATFRREQGGGEPGNRVVLLELTKGQGVTLELVKGTLSRGELNENTLSGFLLFNIEDTDCKRD